MQFHLVSLIQSHWWWMAIKAQLITGFHWQQWCRETECWLTLPHFTLIDAVLIWEAWVKKSYRIEITTSTLYHRMTVEEQLTVKFPWHFFGKGIRAPCCLLLMRDEWKISSVFNSTYTTILTGKHFLLREGTACFCQQGHGRSGLFWSCQHYTVRGIGTLSASKQQWM